MSNKTLLIELGTEELPPKALKSLGLAFRDGITAGLKQRELGFGEVSWFASPRRLAVQIAQVQTQGEDKNIEVLGPPIDRARDSEGNWTPAASGFAKKQGVAAQDLQEIETPKGTRLGLKRSRQACTPVTASMTSLLKPSPVCLFQSACAGVPAESNLFARCNG